MQGVGFRPFVYGLASRFRVAGHVGNDVHGVFIDAEGSAADVERFLTAVRDDAPPLAEVEHVTVSEAAPLGAREFTIVASEAGGTRNTLVSADSATCQDCLRELHDPADRRYSYPFINCTNCGPRFTIVRDVPYDRPLTTMSDFPMCEGCAAEYHDPTDRRFHAQPVCCPECGPHVTLTGPGGDVVEGEPIATAAELLRRGRVLAVKGLGGYHLAADASSEAATAALRARKHREDKPFAVMAPSLAEARSLCTVDATAERMLTGRRRPIVLLDRRRGTNVAGPVAPGNRQLGVMLPYTPLHHLLLERFRGPMVLTSGNVSDEPIAYTDDDAYTRLAGIVDAFLTHDRPIHVRADDSVTRPFRDHHTVLRRSRGYAPEPIAVPWEFARPVLACGAELKNTFCLAQGNHAFVSQHIGDLENYETLRSFQDGVEHFERLFEIRPEVVAHDLHPDYLSTKYAQERAGVELVGVQHHHAHIAACLADNRETGPVIGVAFDGTGFGTDGTIWGGEFLLADLTGFTRVGHLRAVPLPGGASAIRQPWRMAVSYLDAAFDGEIPGALRVLARNPSWRSVASLAESGTNAPPTSSAGRLFDAAAALLGVRDAVNYEGQAAIELEQLADLDEGGSYPIAVGAGPVVTLDGTQIVRAVADDIGTGVPVPVIAARFHNGVVDAIVRTCELLRESHGTATVALSGGVFQNLLLLTRTVDRLSERDFRVLTHSRVPCNDGGISLGQAVVAGASRADRLSGDVAC